MVQDLAIIGSSPALLHALALARKVAPTDLPILLVGETGTGKELFAGEIHRISGLKGPLVDVNCAALPDAMADALLFGHRKGSFTGAIDHSEGLVEAARGGTLFLDELTSMPTVAQAKLLRAIETYEIRRVGETTKRRVPFRVVAAMQEELAESEEGRTVRNDLVQRLAGIVIQLPSLVERDGDVIQLAGHFAALEGRSLGSGSDRILLTHPWPGNVRELQMTIRRACVLTSALELSSEVLAESIRHGMSQPVGRAAFPVGPGTLKERILAVFEANDWNTERTAHALGMGRTTFFKRLKTLGISLREERTSIERKMQHMEGPSLRPRPRPFSGVRERTTSSGPSPDTTD